MLKTYSIGNLWSEMSELTTTNANVIMSTYFNVTSSGRWNDEPDHAVFAWAINSGIPHGGVTRHWSRQVARGWHKLFWGGIGGLRETGNDFSYLDRIEWRKKARSRQIREALWFRERDIIKPLKSLHQENA